MQLAQELVDRPADGGDEVSPEVAADILRQRTFPRDWHRQKQGIKTLVIETFADVTPRGENQTLVLIGNIQRGIRGLPVLCGHAATKDNELLGKPGEPPLKVIEVILPLG